MRRLVRHRYSFTLASGREFGMFLSVKIMVVLNLSMSFQVISRPVG